MPELPEVETIRRGLAQRVLNQKIIQVKLRLPKMVKSPLNEFLNVLEENHFSDVDRQGKLLIFHLANNPDNVMLLHLKMTGQLIYRHGTEQVAGGHPWPSYNEELPNKYSHLIFTFANGAHLYFNDQRQFGYVELTTQTQLTKRREKYGIEPLTSRFTRQAFHRLFQNRRTQLKALLLNQALISGVGNIYADEICFFARLRPDRPVNTLTSADINQVYDACQTILATAVRHQGTTISDFVTTDGKQGNYADFLHVYGRTEENCHRCSGNIRKTKVAGRGTHFCEACQK